MSALKRANDIRLARAKVIKDLKRRRVSIVPLLQDPPEFLLATRIFDLLLAVPSFGRVRTDRILAQARISRHRTLGAMSQRQRRTLVHLLISRGESQSPPKPLGRVETRTTTRTEARGSREEARDAAELLLAEWRRLLGEQDLDRSTLERAAKLAAAEETWRKGLGTLFTEDETAELLGTEPSQLKLMEWNEELIVLPTADGGDRYPAFQFQDGRISRPLARAYWTLVKQGLISPWTAASWARSDHPELEGLSPAQWIGDHRDEATLAEVAEHDASRLSQ